MTHHDLRNAQGKYVRADGLLKAMSVVEERHCVFCGRAFRCYSASNKATCSPKCNTKRWRSIGMLAGTHGYVDGRWRRLA